MGLFLGHAWGARRPLWQERYLHVMFCAFVDGCARVGMAAARGHGSSRRTT